MEHWVKPALLVPMLGVNLLELGAQTANVQGGGSGGSNQTVMITLIAQAVIFLTTVAGFLYNIYRENRNRRWDLEDRARAREEQLRTTAVAAASVKSSLDVHNIVQEAKQEELKQVIVEKLDKNTAITQEAAQKAALADRRLAEIRALFEGEASARLERVEENTQETVELLRDDKSTESGPVARRP